MKKVLCTQCPQCGLYNAEHVKKCECGISLENLSTQLIDTDLLPASKLGRIDTSKKLYVQKCSACGTLNYTYNPAEPVKICRTCHKTRVASITPIEYSEQSNEQNPPKKTAEPIKFSPVPSSHIPQNPQSTPPASTATENNVINNEAASSWLTLMQNSQNLTSLQGVYDSASTEPSPPVAPIPPITTQNDDDDDNVGWGTLGKSAAPSPQPAFQAAKKQITLTATQYGRLTFTLTANTEPYLLGRSANQADFLSQDRRVSNEHCYIIYKQERWYVKDNHSSNGTAINSRDIGINGERELNDGDELKLGHHPDSITFHIAIS